MLVVLGNNVSAQSQDPCAGERANLKRLYAQQTEQIKNPNNYTLADANRLGGDITTALKTLADCEKAHGNAGNAKPTTPAKPATPPQNGTAQPANPSSGSGNAGQSVDDVVNQAIWKKLLGVRKFSYQLVNPAYPDFLMQIQGTVIISGYMDSPKVTIECFNTTKVTSTGEQNRYPMQFISTDSSLNMKDTYTCIALYSRETRSLVFSVKNKKARGPGDSADTTFKVVEGGRVSMSVSCKDADWDRASVILE